MKYNLAKYTQTISNIIDGDISLTNDEIINIITTLSGAVALPSGILILESDLGARVHIDEIQYYFDSPAPINTVASGIKFYYKNESFETYTALNTYYGAGYYYTLASGTDAPRYIKVEHTIISGTGGYLNGFQILNDDTYVDFGDDGNDTSTNFMLSVENAIIEINELEVFNSGPIKANAKLIIEPQNTVADDVLSISDSPDGPWYGVYRDADKITGADLWESGNMVNVQESSNILTLSIGNTVGTYTTRIIKLDDYQRLTFNVMSYNYPTSASGTSIIATAGIDTTENIEVRSSNSRPIDRESYIWMSGTYSPAYKYTNHNWIADGSVAEQSNDWGTWGQTSNFWEYWYDSIREDEYIVDKPFYTGGNTEVTFRIRRKNGALYSTTITNTTYTNDCFYSTYKISPDSYGGFWINFFLARGNINNGIYYLRYYDSTMNLIYNRQTDAGQGTFLYDMDAVYNIDGYLWYADSELSTVFKINNSGTVLASYLATEGLRGILSLDDGGCWFIQDQALLRLDTNGQLIDEIELPTEFASYVYSDLDGGFWLHAGETVYHLSSDGTEYFNITIPNLYHITVINSGFITKEHDGSTTNLPKASYVSKDHKRIIRTWDYPRTEGGYEGSFDYNRYGARSQTYDDLVDDHASHFPITIDTGWDNSIWKTVSLRDYNFTNEQYHQIRFTLRANNSANSPEVYGLWTQRAIEIPNIYPNNYGKFYLKSDITYLSPQDIGNYTSKVRAYWLLDAE
jgi:hypothetical protein